MEESENTFIGKKDSANSGQDYEYLIAAYFSLVLMFNEDIADFKVSTNNNDFGDFDDVVCEIIFKNGAKHLVAFQLKYVLKPVSFHSLIVQSAKKSDKFYLRKYRENFYKVQKEYVASTSHEVPVENCHFILFTNASLENAEQIDTKGTRLETTYNHENPIHVVSEFVLRKSKHCFEDIFNTNNTMNGIFQIDIPESPNDDFCQKFFLYFKQKDATDILKEVTKLMSLKFPDTTENTVLSYVNFFYYWKRLEFGNYKLQREDIQAKLGELFLTALVPAPNLKILLDYPQPDVLLFIILFDLFDVFLINAESVNIQEIWSILLFSFKNLIAEAVDWESALQIFSNDIVRSKAGFPMSAYSESYTRLTMKKFYLQIWHCGQFPLPIESTKSTPAILQLYLNMTKQRKFLLIDRTDVQLTGNWKIFRNLSDLLVHKDIYGYILQNLTVYLQGRKMSLLDFTSLYDSFPEVITFQDLVSMISGEFLIGRDSRKHLPKCYIPRNISTICLNIQVLEQIDDIFLLTNYNMETDGHLNINAIDIETYMQLQGTEGMKYIPKKFALSQIETNPNIASDKFVIVAKTPITDNDFQKICLYKQGENYHHVCFTDKTTVKWINTVGSVEKLHPFRIDSSEFIEDSRALKYFDKNINLLCAEAGMGKTIVLEQLKLTVPHDILPMTINVNQSHSFFKHKHTVLEFLNYLTNQEDRSLEKKVVECFTASKKVIFFWDAVDEIAEDCLDNVTYMIKALTFEGYHNWVSARTNSKPFWEKAYGTLALTLAQFSLEDQGSYIQHRLCEKYSNENFIRDLFLKISTNISLSLTCTYFDYSGIPLHIHMLVEIYLKNTPTTDLQIVSLTDLYRAFINGKFDVLFQKAEAEEMEELKELFQSNHILEYQAAALKASFDKETFQKLSLDCDDLLEDIKASQDNLGLIAHVTDDLQPVFVHTTYKEFLTATWFSENCKRYSHLVPLLYQRRHSNTRFMFDMLMANSSNVFLSVLYRNSEILNKHKEDIPGAVDLLGRNALHIACSWGEPHPAVATIKSRKDRPRNAPSIEEKNRFVALMHHQMKKLNPNLVELATESELSKKAAEKIYLKRLKSVEEQFNDDASNDSTVYIYFPSLSEVREEDPTYIEILSLLLHHRDILDVSDNLLNWNPVDFAFHSDSLSAVNILLSSSITVDEDLLRNHNVTLLHYAIIQRYDNILDSLTDIPFIEYVYENGCSLNLLKTACEVNNTHAALKLLEEQSYKDVINREDLFGATPLIAATIQSNKEIINALLQNGAKTTGFTSSALCAAVVTGNTDCVEILLKNAADVNQANPEGDSPLIFAAMIEHIELTEVLLQWSANVNYENKGLTAMHYAVYRQNVEMLEMLLQNAGNVNSQCDSLGYSLLHNACELDNLAIVKVLLKYGADTKLKSKKRQTPLHVALVHKQNNIVSELIRQDPSVVNEFTIDDGSSKLSPLLLATFYNNPEAVEELLQAGADVESSPGYLAPLHAAVGQGFEDCVTILLKHGASVNATDSSGFTPIFNSIPYPSIMKILRQKGADLYHRAQHGRTFFHQLASSGQVEELTDVTIKDDFGRTPLYYALFENQAQAVKHLLQSRDTNEDGEMLCLAAISRLTEMITLLISNGIDVNARDKLENTALFYAVYSSDDIVKILLGNGANPNIPGTLGGIPNISLITIPLLHGKIDIVNQLIAAGLDINMGLASSNALHIAVATNDIMCVTTLLKAGASVNSVNDNGESALHYLSGGLPDLAVLKEMTSVLPDLRFSLNKMDCAVELLSQNADVNLKNVNGTTPMHAAVCAKDGSQLVKLFLAHGADPNSTDNNGQTPLHVCIIFGHLEVAPMLIEAGASLDLVDNLGKTPLSYGVDRLAKDWANFKSVEILFELGVPIGRPNFEQYTILHKSIANGNESLVRTLMEAGVPVDCETSQGCTPLFYACDVNNLEIVQKLIEKSVNVNHQMQGGNTALHIACEKCSGGVVEALLTAGADCDICNEVNATPLHVCARAGNSTAFKALLRRRQKFNQADNAGFTALHCIICNRNAELLNILVQEKFGNAFDDQDSSQLLVDAIMTNDRDEVASVQSRFSTSFQGNLLMVFLNAAVKADFPLMETLLDHDLVDINESDSETSLTSLHLVCAMTDEKIADFLIRRGADVNVTTPENFTPVYISASIGSLEVTKTLVEAGADVNISSWHGNSPLFAAAARGHLHIVKYLVENSASIDKIDQDGDTPLHDAACNGHIETVEYLLDKGADPGLKNNNGETPLDIAIKNRHMEITQFFLNK